MAGLVLEHVSKEFANGVRAVCDLNLEVAEGELVVLVGPSGCGKTTTLRLIAGLEHPTRGAIRIGEQPVHDLEPHRRRVALVFQRPALYPHLDVRGNLAFGLRLQHSLWRPQRLEDKRVEEDRVAQAAQMLGLEDVLARRPYELSGGQQQRVALGRAIVRQPAVFLLDEPLSSLDAQLRMEMRRELHLLHRRLRATMIYVTHDQVEAMTLGDRVVVMYQGRIQQADRPEALYQHPRSRFVAGFIGWPPMNLLDGIIEGRDGRLGVSVGGCWRSLTTSQAEGLASHQGRPVTLGIRPEHVRIAECGEDIGDRPGGTTINPQESVLRMERGAVELLGGRWLLMLRRDELRLTTLLDHPPVEDDRQVVAVSWDMQQAHWFDRASGVALGQKDPEG